MTRAVQVIGWPAFKTADTNPYQALLYRAVAPHDVQVVECTLSALVSAPRGAILHLHWPDAFVANATLPIAVLKLLALRLLAFWCAARGVLWVWTAHNLQRPTQRHATLLNALFWPWFVHRLHAVLYLSKASRQTAEARFPALANRPSAITPHGRYPVPPCARVAQNRTELLFFGGVSPYKRVGDLVRAFADLDRPDLHLRISGATSRSQPDTDVTAALAGVQPHLKDSVTREDMFLSDTELAARVHAARLVVLPFAAVQNSGSVLYALSCNRPVLVPNLPPFQDLRAGVGATWVHLFDGPLTASDLQSALEIAPEGAPDLTAFAWPAIGAQTAAFLKQVTP